MESSPRFRNTGQDNATSSHGSSAAGSIYKLRLMCSNGGHIVPRPHDRSLCYIGGETRMVVVDRHTTLRELTHRLSKTLLRSSTAPAFTLKYQLPSEDLDSLISVTNDEDLENMIEEYERLMNSSSSTAASKSSRLRLFLFPTNPESVSSTGSFLKKSTKSEDWFLNALNGSGSGFSDTSSVNCLLGLDDYIEISPPEAEKKDANLRGNNSGQDVHSIPDSPMMETTSSFGSASSLANLPPIRVINAGDHQKVLREGGIEEQLSDQQDDGGGLMASPMTTVREHSDPFLSNYLKHQQQQQKQSTTFGLATQNSALIGDLNTITDRSSPVVQIQSPNPDDARIQTQQQQQQIQNSAYLLSQIESQIYHQQLPPLQRYIQNHQPSTASYYNHNPHHPPTDHQNLMYYMPVRQLPPQGQAYNFPFQAALKTEFPVDDVYRPTYSGAPPQLVRVPSASGHQNQAHYVYTTQSAAGTVSKSDIQFTS